MSYIFLYSILIFNLALTAGDEPEMQNKSFISSALKETTSKINNKKNLFSNVSTQDVAKGVEKGRQAANIIGMGSAVALAIHDYHKESASLNAALFVLLMQSVAIAPAAANKSSEYTALHILFYVANALCYPLTTVASVMFSSPPNKKPDYTGGAMLGIVGLASLVNLVSGPLLWYLKKPAVESTASVLKNDLDEERQLKNPVKS